MSNDTKWQTPAQFGATFGLSDQAARRHIRQGRIPKRLLRNVGAQGKNARYLIHPDAAAIAYAA